MPNPTIPAFLHHRPFLYMTNQMPAGSAFTRHLSVLVPTPTTTSGIDALCKPEPTGSNNEFGPCSPDVTQDTRYITFRAMPGHKVPEIAKSRNAPWTWVDLPYPTNQDTLEGIQFKPRSDKEKKVVVVVNGIVGSGEPDNRSFIRYPYFDELVSYWSPELLPAVTSQGESLPHLHLIFTPQSTYELWVLIPGDKPVDSVAIVRNAGFPEVLVTLTMGNSTDQNFGLQRIDLGSGLAGNDSIVVAMSNATVNGGGVVRVDDAEPTPKTWFLSK